MPSQKNIDQVNDLSEKLARAKAVLITDHTGLSVAEQRQLRESVIEAGGQFLVAKNRLFKLAFSRSRNNHLPQDIEDVLQGPTSLLFAFEDEIAPLKAIVTFSQSHERPHVKLGILLDPEDKVLTAEEVVTLAKLPTKNQLIAQLIGTLNAPGYNLVHVLSGNIRKLSLILTALLEKKESN
ncbi:MAG: 50S ribosomal protein L10 [Candidatus Chisholmbacteria bacterium RIFCSPHIGHO2_01_FULL_49_18]|uniref:Large ribosomal subunit protein uL10 n=1 Tax=Candidatus Chisholmbacteria bacterium RIFCSPHIGHO2_01_FULL_49_18 TaxID=1797590 RepID=A0A1G1VMN6_9BACT|nr:MAG: 50S ribosomal protein L10 [Candidatus Chisholmbacteria bacterium RIFCSPHIGHO2_01_FULL_49_18]